MNATKRLGSWTSVAAAILESSPADAATLSALVADAGWEARTHLEFHQLVRSIEAAGAQLVFISSRDLPPDDTALSVVRRTFAGPLVVLVDDRDELKSRLRQGATLVVQKPFDPEYLELAVRAVLARGEPLRRALGQAAVLGDLRVRLADHTLERRGRRQVLGPAEWQLFAFLMAHPHRILNRSELARGAWGAELPGRESEVELYVSRLRHKVELNPRHPDLILTIRGRGYQLNAVPEPMTLASATTGAELGPPPTTMLGYWQGAYEEIVRVQTRIIDRTYGLPEPTAEPVQSELLSNDLPSLQLEMSRCQARLAFWTEWR